MANELLRRQPSIRAARIRARDAALMPPVRESSFVRLPGLVTVFLFYFSFSVFVCLRRIVIVSITQSYTPSLPPSFHPSLPPSPFALIEGEVKVSGLTERDRDSTRRPGDVLVGRASLESVRRKRSRDGEADKGKPDRGRETCIDMRTLNVCMCKLICIMNMMDKYVGGTYRSCGHEWKYT